MRIDQREDIMIEMARVEREELDKITTRMASQQLGEAWITEDRREVTTIKRGPQRRKWKKGQAVEKFTGRDGV